MPNKKTSRIKPTEAVQAPMVDDALKEALDATKVQDAEPEVASNFPIVGIGASAGGLAAFKAFFSGMPPKDDPGMAFVLVQHLAPDHKSILTDLIQRFTRMKAFEVEDGMIVKPNCVYIIPPDCNMALQNGTLLLLRPSAACGPRLPIDYFFHSLAQDQHDRAIGIILSGTGSDGTAGMRAIKAAGGMVMVESLTSTEYDGMPRSAISTGLVDYELTPAEMPARLIAYVAHSITRQPQSSSVLQPKEENTLQKIFVLLRGQTGHDFSQYTPGTIRRRIERRMNINQVDRIDHYLSFIQQSPAEVDALFHDLLIGVTSFFRDPEAFLALQEQVIPNLFAKKTVGSTIRVWIPGCSTGEEAYSIAILLHEHMEAIQQQYTIQIFATDIDNQAIAIARKGIYSASIATEITPERLVRYFTQELEGSAYQIHKSIRDTLVFSEQDVIKDPPFSKMDIISCRNLLIYLSSSLQKKLIPMFYYSLNAEGVLFLGASESIGEFGHLFDPMDRKARLFIRAEGIKNVARPPISQFIPATMLVRSRTLRKTELIIKEPLKEIVENALLQQEYLSGVLVNSFGDILYLHGHTGLFLELTQGEAGINNITKMARAGLKHELTAALHKAVTSKQTVRRENIHVKTDNRTLVMNMSILPIPADTQALSLAHLYLAVFDELPSATTSAKQSASSNGKTDDSAVIDALKHDLQMKEEYLQSANEELETINEELNSSYEELQSVNEEMQSTNEELETSKEELQSINEELATVNAELQTKVSDLSRTNNDLSNLLAGTGIGTIFVNHQQQVMRFTPSVNDIIHLILSDIGRPLTHIASNLATYNSFTTDIQQVLDTLIPKEMELQTTNGKWYNMRIQPYRTVENMIEGAVLTFVDITGTVNAREALRRANDILRMAVVVRDSRDAITMQGLDGQIMAWNPAASRIYGWIESEALLMNVRDRIPENQQLEELNILSKLAQTKVSEPYRSKRLTKDGSVVEIWIIASALVNDSGQIYAVATTERLIKEPLEKM